MKTQEKYCPRCGCNHPVTDFYKDSSRASGLSVYCKKTFSDDKREKYMSDNPVPDIAAFRSALQDMDYETQTIVDGLIEQLAEYMQGQGHPRTLDTARDHAAQTVAQMIFKGEYDRLITERITA